MSKDLSRRGLLGGLLAALVGLLTGKPQARSAPAPSVPPVSAAPLPSHLPVAEVEWTSHSVYDIEGNLLSYTCSSDKEYPRQEYPFQGDSGNPTEDQSKKNLPDNPTGEQTS